MTYIKLISAGRRKHLALAEHLADRPMTLCGGTLTRINGWKRVTHLEGDECERCAEHAFALTGPAKNSIRTHVGTCTV